MITVVIVDDHPIVRAGMRAVLGAAGDMEILAEGASGADALRLAAGHTPDVLVLDVNLPDQSGVEVTRQLCAREVHPAVLILTVHRDSATVFGLLECGALGYVVKDEALETLPAAVRAVAHGQSWLSPAVASQVVRRAMGHSPVAETGLDTLTPSERQVLALLANGLNNTAIAGHLVVTRRTVQNHVSNIYGKLGLAGRAEAVLYALRHHLAEISTDDADADRRG